MNIIARLAQINARLHKSFSEIATAVTDDGRAAELIYRVKITSLEQLFINLLLCSKLSMKLQP